MCISGDVDDDSEFTVLGDECVRLYLWIQDIKVADGNEHTGYLRPQFCQAYERCFD